MLEKDLPKVSELLLSRKEKLLILRNIYLVPEITRKPNITTYKSNNSNKLTPKNTMIDSYNINAQMKLTSNGFSKKNQFEQDENDKSNLPENSNLQTRQVSTGYPNISDKFLTQNEKSKDILLSSFKSAKPGNRSLNTKLMTKPENRKLFSGNELLKRDKPKIIDARERSINMKLKDYLKNNQTNLKIKSGQRIKVVSQKSKNNASAAATKIEDCKTPSFNLLEECTALDYATKEEQNRECRKTMEDFTNVNVDFHGDKNNYLFGLYDGHGGDDVAKIAKDKLPKNLSKMLNNTKLSVENAIINSFKLTDEDFKHYETTGSTVCLVYITKERGKRIFYSANIGDSAIFLLNDKKASKISFDHKCLDVNENERIKSSGGVIFGGRVFGQLNLTRALGDFGLKKYGVCPIPHITKHIIESNDTYIVIGSDGIWDVINEELVHELSLTIANSEEFCDILVKRAISLGSLDNISCIAIKLN